MCDCASWHTSLEMAVPENVLIFNIPPCTPEMNPMEQIWREIRTQGFHNRMFDSLIEAIEQLCKVIRELDRATIISITGRQWLSQCF
jgi:transposase